MAKADFGLVLSRRVGQQIVIGEGDVQSTVTVVGIGRGRVSVAVKAPAKLLVDRREVYERRQAEKLSHSSNDQGGQHVNGNDANRGDETRGSEQRGGEANPAAGESSEAA